MSQAPNINYLTSEWLAKENNMKDLATNWGRPLVSDQQDLSTV